MSSNTQQDGPVKGLASAPSAGSAHGPRVGVRSVLEVQIDPSDVGRRVTLRRVLPDGSGGLGDVVGVLESWDAGELHLRRRRGDRVQVSAASIVAARVVAPEVSSAALQRVCAGDAIPDEQTAQHGWLLRAHHGLTRRSSSALVVDVAVSSAVEGLPTVQRWYAERDLPALILVVEGSRADVELANAGLPVVLRNEVWVAEADAVLAALGARTVPMGSRIDVSATASEHLVMTHCADDSRRDDFRRLVESVPTTLFLTATDGEVVADLRLTPRDGWSGITFLAVEPRYQRRGIATQLLANAARQAKQAGHPRLWLQVERENTAAHALYRRAGFTRHHGYAYRDAS